MSQNPGLDQVNARITFEGVMLACINNKDQYEVGMVVCPYHKPEIIVVRTENGSSTKTPVPWPAGDDLLFKVNHPDVEGVSQDRTADSKHRFFRVLDIEGLFMHRDGVKVDNNKLKGRRLAVTAGRLYTHELTEIEFNLLTWIDQNDPGTKVGHIGKIAKIVGLNILWTDKPGSGIEIINLRTHKVVYPLPNASGVTYEIHVKNDCSNKRGDRPQVGTDFRHFYLDKLIMSEDGLKFDLGEIGKRSPGACETGLVGQNDGLGIGT